MSPDPTQPYTHFDCSDTASCGHHHRAAGFTRLHAPLLTIDSTWQPDRPLIIDNSVVMGNNATVRNATCPLFRVRQGIIKNIVIECTNGRPAIELDLAPGLAVTVTNVRVPPMQVLLSGVHPIGATVQSLYVGSGSAGVVVLGNLNPTGNIEVECIVPTDILLVSKQTKINPTTTCTSVTLENIVGVLGSQYEMDYLYRNAELDPVGHLYRIGLAVLGGALVAAFVWTIGTNGKQLRMLVMHHKIDELEELVAFVPDK